MKDLADDLYASLQGRVVDLEALITSLQGRLASSREGLRKALELFSYYPNALRTKASSDWNKGGRPEHLVDQLRFYLAHLKSRSNFLEEFFAPGADEWIPTSLISAVEDECRELLGEERYAVLAVGAADNFETLVDDLLPLIFAGGVSSAAIPSEITRSRFAVLRIPRVEGGQALWRPLVIGHELAHLALADRGVSDAFDIDRRISADPPSATDHPPQVEKIVPVETALAEVGDRWLEELVCDAYALRRFGPAGVVAIASFLEMVGATDQASNHPPGWLRTSLLLQWLGPVREPRLRRILRPWEDLAAVKPRFRPWAEYLIRLFQRSSTEVLGLLNAPEWPARYRFDTRSSSIVSIANALQRGVPPAEFPPGAPLSGPVDDPDVINAGWLSRAEKSRMPLTHLVDKALESAEFLRKWSGAGGSIVGAGRPPENTDSRIEEAGGACLSAEGIRRRLEADPERQLVVTPFLGDAPKGAALDVRLGRKFIVFKRSRIGHFDPMARDDDPRTMQENVEVGWGEPFILHPDELVLASTLEYLVLPSDLACQVVTRSSYGRLGLITATAVLVHPHFKGCLTLELVNLGKLPIALMPGSRIGQLTVHPVAPAVEPGVVDDKYYCPTGPEFSKVSADTDFEVLRHFRG